MAEHHLAPLAFAPEPTRPLYLLGCTDRGCIVTETRCVLCEDDGDRRKHRSRHDPVTDPELHDQAAFRLAAIALRARERAEHSPAPNALPERDSPRAQ